MKKLNKIIPAMLVASGVVIGASVVTFAESGLKSKLFPNPDVQKPVEFKIPEYEVNDNGETFGSAMDVSPENFPDLTYVIGDNGIYGYAKTVDLMGETPSSPEEAIKQQEERKRSGVTKRVIDVYKKDGVTVIDTFTMESEEVILEYESN